VNVKEGCNLFGFLEVNKVAGNFHIAPGKAFESAAGQLIHEFKPFDSNTYASLYINIEIEIEIERVRERERCV